MKDFNFCKECGTQLKKVKIKRTKPLPCSNCRGNSQNFAFREILKEVQAVSVAEEGRFEDVAHDPEEGIMMRTKPSPYIGVKSSLGSL